MTIEVRNLRKEFETTPPTKFRHLCRRPCKIFQREKKKIVAVDDVTFRVYSDELIVLLGHNGAGKSTLINLLTTLIRPTSGQATIDGVDIVADSRRARARLGYCLQQDVLWDELTVDEHLRFYGLLKGLNFEELKQETQAIVNQVRRRKRAAK